MKNNRPTLPTDKEATAIRHNVKTDFSYQSLSFQFPFQAIIGFQRQLLFLLPTTTFPRPYWSVQPRDSPVYSSRKGLVVPHYFQSIHNIPFSFNSVSSRRKHSNFVSCFLDTYSSANKGGVSSSTSLHSTSSLSPKGNGQPFNLIFFICLFSSHVYKATRACSLPAKTVTKKTAARPPLSLLLETFPPILYTIGCVESYPDSVA